MERGEGLLLDAFSSSNMKGWSFTRRSQLDASAAPISCRSPLTLDLASPTHEASCYLPMLLVGLALRLARLSLYCGSYLCIVHHRMCDCVLSLSLVGWCNAFPRGETFGAVGRMVCPQIFALQSTLVTPALPRAFGTNHPNSPRPSK
jgi:hypothetical protein